MWLNEGDVAVFGANHYSSGGPAPGIEPTPPNCSARKVRGLHLCTTAPELAVVMYFVCGSGCTVGAAGWMISAEKNPKRMRLNSHDAGTF